MLWLQLKVSGIVHIFKRVTLICLRSLYKEHKMNAYYDIVEFNFCLYRSTLLYMNRKLNSVRFLKQQLIV
jgi:hypothetical protein